MNEEEIRKIVKETFDKNIMNNLDSSIVFKYVQTLEKENKKYKEIINKLRKVIEKMLNIYPANNREYDYYVSKIDDILKEVEHE